MRYCLSSDMKKIIKYKDHWTGTSARQLQLESSNESVTVLNKY